MDRSGEFEYMGMRTRPEINVGPPTYEFNEPFFIFSSYELGEDQGRPYLEINDAVWGEHKIGDRPGDELLLRVLHNPLLIRSMSIEQLTLSPEHSTLPNTGNFSRWEHIWGSVVFVRKMIDTSPELQDLSDREKLVLQLRTFLSDLGHTAYSHMGDWITQGFGGTEDAHDDELMQVLEASGLNDELRSYGIDPKEVVFPDTEDWIEKSSPDLCVDRVDYSVREILRWMDKDQDIHNLKHESTFRVVDGEIVVADRARATALLKGYSLLATEHWGAPVHRLQLALLQETVKHSILGHHLFAQGVINRPTNPRDVLYTVDSDFNIQLKTTDQFLWTIGPIMAEIGKQQRTIFVQQRESLIQSFLGRDRFEEFSKSLKGDRNRDETWSYPEPGRVHSEYGYHHHMTQQNSRVVIVPVEDGPGDVDDYEQNPYTVDFYLPPLKQRSIDPLFFEDGEIKRLSKVEPRVGQLQEDQKRIASQAYVARLLVSPDYRKVIADGMSQIEDKWGEAMKIPRMDKERFGELLDEAARFPIQRLIDINWLV